MAMTTKQWTKNISRQVYLPAFTQNLDKYTWSWDKISTTETSDHATEQVFSYAGMGAAVATRELQYGAYRDLTELAATTFTHTKYTLGSIISEEAQDDGKYVNLLKVAGEESAIGLAYVVDLTVANVFANAFSTSSAYYLWDSTGMCSTHTLADGSTTVSNALTTGSITFANAWLAMNYFTQTALRQDGLPITAGGKFYLLYHPLREKNARKVFKNTTGFEPDQADRNSNTLAGYDVELVPCRFLGTAQWFLINEKFKKDMRFFWRRRPTPKRNEDFDKAGMKILSSERFSTNAADWTYIVGNPGS